MRASMSLLSAFGICGAVFLSGCGGGSGSDSGDGEVSTQPPLDVSVTEANVISGAEVAQTLLGMDTAAKESRIMAASLVASNGFDPLKFGIAQGKRFKRTYAQSVQSTPADWTEDCVSGDVSYSVSSSASSGNATVTYRQCADFDGMTLDGQVKIAVTGDNIDQDDYVLASQTMDFLTDFAITQSGVTVMIRKGSSADYGYTTYDRNNDVYAGTAISSQWFSVGNTDYRYDDLNEEFLDDEWVNGVRTRCYKAGRVYVNDLAGYLDIDSAYDANCSNKFKWEYDNLISGSMALMGNTNSRVRVEADGNGWYRVITVLN